MKKIRLLLLTITFVMTSFGVASAMYYPEFPAYSYGYGNNYNSSYYSYPTYVSPYTYSNYSYGYQYPETYPTMYYQQSYQYTSGCTIYYFNGYNGQTTAIGTTCNPNYYPSATYYQDTNSYYQYQNNGWNNQNTYYNCGYSYSGMYSYYVNNDINCRPMNTSCYYTNGITICN